MSKTPKIKPIKDWLKKNWVGLIAIIISVISLWYTHEQSLLAFRLAHLHIEPEIKTQFHLKKGERNPTIVLANVGNIPVVSASVNYKVFIFNKETRKIETAAKGSSFSAPGALYSEYLKPGGNPEMQLLGIDAKGRLIVYEFNLKYFRESDMLEYNRKDYYFIDNDILLNHSQFRNYPLYRDVMSNIASFSFDTPKGEPNQVLTQPYFQHSESP